MIKKLPSGGRLTEILFLGLLLASLGLIFVPNARTTLWMDYEFSGWVAPVSNRFANGQVLYGDGGHMPLPPIPFVLIYLLTNGHATWLTESLFNYLSQALIILVLYFGFSFYLPRPVPFLAALGTIPIFLATPKTILYDASSQLVAAIVILLAVSYAGLKPLSAPTIEIEQNNAFNPPALPKATLLGLFTSLGLLTKQSIGAGTLVGVIALLLVFPLGAPRRIRLQNIALFLAMSFLTFVPLCLSLSPFINIGGMLNDVFLTGTEPKGGFWRFLLNLGSYSREIGVLLFGAGLVILICFRVFGLPGGLHSKPIPEKIETESSSDWKIPGWIESIAGLVSLGVLIGMIWTGSLSEYFGALNLVFQSMLSIGLLLCLYAVAAIIFPNHLPRLPYFEAIAAIALVAFPSMIGHTLSVVEFWWWRYNNPMIMVALAALFLVILPGLPQTLNLRFVSRDLLLLSVIGLVFVGLWLPLNNELTAAGKANEKWPEISYLANAELPRRGADMRDLVQLVRDLTSTAGKDEVLLLPNDPNVEAWFDRPRPKLTSAIIFTDQYWDKYVETDLARLKANPPQVIIIGPQGFWRSFSRIWNKNWGAERLIDRIQTDLLPDYYELNRDFEILFQGRTEIMSIYVKK